MGGCLSWCGLGALPVVLLVLTTATFLTTYTMGVVDGDISANFPYISDTGAKPPESCVFTLLLSICGFIAFVIVFIRYKQVAEYNKQDIQRVLVLNRYAFYGGTVAALGMLVVASFQEFNAQIVHLVGAIMVFAVGCVYSWLQTAMTWRMRRSSETRLLDVRFGISLLTTACLITTFIFMGIARAKFDPPYPDEHHNETLNWKSSYGGYRYHIASTASEWAMGGLFLLFFLTFFKDFQRITLDVQIRLRLLENFTFSSSGTINRSAMNDDDGGIW